MKDFVFADVHANVADAACSLRELFDSHPVE
jgi:hypothetical protein